jgi:hypothetical protein
MPERGALDLGVRALRLLIENARPETGSEPDILVLPDIEPRLSETYFPADATDVLQSGYDAVIEQVPPVPEQPAVRRAPGAAPARIAAVRVDGADAAFERLIRRVMNDAVGPYDAADIVRRTAALYATGLFQAVWPRVELEPEPTLVIEVTPAASANMAGAARWDNDIGGGAWASLQRRVSLNTPVQFVLAGTVDEIGYEAGAETSFFSALIPGLRWTGGAQTIEERVRVFDADTVTDLLTVRRHGVRAGAEVHGPVRDWFLSLFATADQVREPGAAAAWAAGPVLRIFRAPPPDRVAGVDQLLEAEIRGGDLSYQRARLRAGHTIVIRRAQAAAIVDFAAASPQTPLDARPATDHNTAPWLPYASLRSRQLASIGVDGAVPTFLSGYARVRLRALAATDDVEAFSDSDTWRLGGEVAAVWPTVLGPIELGVAAGQRAKWRFNISIGAEF